MNTDVQSESYEQVRIAVHRQWDPIGVSAYSDEMGEHDGYIPELYMLVESKADREAIIEHLWSVEIIAMGLSGVGPKPKDLQINF